MLSSAASEPDRARETYVDTDRAATQKRGPEDSALASEQARYSTVGRLLQNGDLDNLLNPRPTEAGRTAIRIEGAAAVAGSVYGQVAHAKGP